MLKWEQDFQWGANNWKAYISPSDFTDGVRLVSISPYALGGYQYSIVLHRGDNGRLPGRTVIYGFGDYRQITMEKAEQKLLEIREWVKSK